ncbi:MAG TPA: 3-mercaptopyruvate sulfurtransferase [Gemmatimonadales bacterium]|nr:3-mercaptopyruvate sulfurtransferase [Gemmatimonadales bacterium]
MSGSLPAVVSTEWLATKLGTPGLRVLDASWYLPGSGRDAAAEYAAGHIPGAVFYDIDANSDRRSPLPHMLPTAPEFAATMTALGLSDSDTLVVYDGSGTNLSAPRVWWTFRTFGHDQVAVLDGGIGKWRREHRPVESGIVALPPGRFTARLDSSAVRDLAAVRANIHNGTEQLVDLRSRERFTGAAPEPRPGLRRGHVPGSVNLPFTELVQPDGTVLAPEELRRRLADAGIDASRPVVATCGSGTSACSLILSLHLIGHTQAAVYDGAWAEWGGRADTPVESQPAPKG